jgi:hypothetical protein
MQAALLHTETLVRNKQAPQNPTNNRLVNFRTRPGIVFPTFLETCRAQLATADGVDPAACATPGSPACPACLCGLASPYKHRCFIVCTIYN